jgi:hypothetical protein
MRRTVLGVGALLLMAPLLSSPAFAARGKPSKPTDRVVIDTVKVQGSGCKKTATVAMSADNSAFTVTYSAYDVQVGPDAGKRGDAKDCRLTLKMDVPKGYTYAIEGVIHRGYAHLEKGATVKYVAGYHFNGGGDTYESTKPLAGPLDDNWQVTDIRTSGFEPCGKKRHFIIDTQLTIDGTKSAKTDSSYATLDSADGSLHTDYKLAWKAC